jgi:hypothetical protein
MSDKIPSAVLFLVSSLFTQKLNAIGIANLPVAIRAFQKADKKKLWLYVNGLFQSSVVVSGLFNKWPSIIQVNAIWNIVNAVKESIDARKEEEENDNIKQTEEKPSVSRTIKNFFFSPSQKEPQEKTILSAEETAQQGVKRAKSILAGKRDSATDDVVWGVLQISFVFFNQTYFQAVGHAWMVFLLTILEDAVFNPKLDKKQKSKRLICVVISGYMTGKLVYWESGG